MNTDKLKRIAKALTAGAAAGAGALTTAAVDGNLSAVEWIVVIATAGAAGFAVYKVPNKPAEPAK